MLSRNSKNELLEVVRPRYLKASKFEKQKILDEFTSAMCTLSCTDLCTGWTDVTGLLHRSQQAVSEALRRMRQRLPFPLLGLDSDNGGEFINDLLYQYCLDEKITFTRSRPYQKNDQAHVEQKNWSVVRHTLGYAR